ncbi:hypothetical protein TIFTF001_031334 [Ficus carica]|uniref:Uncharacterized protein n=1 Tax=Ficus carica TaxID=3494 RepID=A0AA88J511_FICCA|nr:hypothetical protein TIFTF001_031334 [Ficus carica]
MKASVRPPGLNVGDLNTVDKPPFSEKRPDAVLGEHGHPTKSYRLTRATPMHLYTFPDWSDLRVAFSAWRVLGAPSAEQILKPSLSKPSTLGTEYRTGLAPTSIPGPYSASNQGLGPRAKWRPSIRPVAPTGLLPTGYPRWPTRPGRPEHPDPQETPINRGRTHKFRYGHFCLAKALPLLLHIGILADLSIGVPTADTTPVSPSFRGASFLQVTDSGATDEY